MKHLCISAVTALMAAGFTGCGELDVPTTGYFGRVDTSACVPTVCPATGNPFAEAKAWQIANPCQPLPDDLACRLRSAYDGEDWPDKVEQAIENASIEAGGFTDLQKEALRCLAYMPGVNQFAIGRPNTRAPEGLTLNIPLKIKGGNRLAAQTYIDRIGPYLGQIWDLGPKYVLKTTLQYDIEITTHAESYAGFTFMYGPKLTVRLDRSTTGPNSDACTDFYLNTRVDSNFVMNMEQMQISEKDRLTPEQARDKVLARYPDCRDIGDSETPLYINNFHLEYLVEVGCTSHCGDPGWPFTARVHAYTGDVRDLSEECCVDCWNIDAMTGQQQDAAQPDSDSPAA